MLQIYKNKVNNFLYYILLTIRPPFFNMENQKPCNARRCPVKKAHFFPFLQTSDYQSDVLLLSYQGHQKRPFCSVFEVPQALE